MTDFNSNFWDERYSTKENVYGKEPNLFLKEQIRNIMSTGKLLLPGEGEKHTGQASVIRFVGEKMV